MNTIYYSEVQKVSNKWIWLLFATMSVIFICSFSEQIIYRHPIGSFTTPDWALALIGLIPLLILYFINTIKLVFQINEEGISYRFYPFHASFKLIKWEEIATISIRKYNAIMEYGGWGIRTFSFRKNIAYSISGSFGLQIELKKGKKILIGTQNPEELKKLTTHIIISK